MIVGFTGTQEGLLSHQRALLRMELFDIQRRFGICEFHHGGCIGADLDAHFVACEVGFEIIVHPSDIRYKQALLPEYMPYTRLDERPPLKRNKDIVKVCDLLIATPSTREERVRSGTWATIRYARKMRRDHKIIFPYGVPLYEVYVDRPLEEFF